MTEMSRDEARTVAREQARKRVERLSPSERATLSAQFQRAEDRARQIMTYGTSVPRAGR